MQAAWRLTFASRCSSSAARFCRMRSLAESRSCSFLSASVVCRSSSAAVRCFSLASSLASVSSAIWRRFASLSALIERILASFCARLR